MSDINELMTSVNNFSQKVKSAMDSGDAANERALVQTLDELTGVFENASAEFNDGGDEGVSTSRTDRLITLEVGLNAIDCSLANNFEKTITAATTLSVTKVPAAGRVYGITLYLSNPNKHPVSFWSGIFWPGGEPPDLTKDTRSVLMFFTRDGGLTWDGMQQGKGGSVTILPEWQLEILTAAEFVTATELAALVNVTQGTMINNNTHWLKFTNNLTGSVRIIPKLSIRHSVTGSHLHTQTPKDESKVINIKGVNYKIRLMSGATTDPAPPETRVAGGEFSELIYSVCSARPSDWKGHQLAQFTQAELGLDAATGIGIRCQCKEFVYDTGTSTTLRGSSGNLQIISHVSSTSVSSLDGWRPILIKV